MLDFLFPKTIETIGSKKIVQTHGEFAVHDGGVEQSGPLVRKIWSKVPLQGNEILILGYGCGAITPLIEGNITGVEIDPQMIKIANKYFHPKGKIIQGDALEFIKKNKKVFDLIIVDLYQGQTFPKQFESQEFLKKLAQTVSKNGSVIFNRLTTKDANFEAKNFIDKLEKYLKIDQTIKVDFNQFYICSRREKR